MGKKAKIVEGRRNAILEFLKSHDNAGRTELAQELGCSRTSARNYLDALCDAGQVVRVSDSRYRLAEALRPPPAAAAPEPPPPPEPEPLHVEFSPTPDALMRSAPDKRELVVHTPDEVLTAAEAYMREIRKRLDTDAKKLDLSSGGVTGAGRAIALRHADSRIAPVLEGMGARAVQPGITWRSLSARRSARRTDKQGSSSIPATFKTKVDNETDILNSYWGWVGILEPEYDLLESWTVLDTESLYAQAIRRKLSLAFRNGVEYVGDNQEFVRYIKRRTQQISYMMGQTFKSFLKDILFNLYVCSNCIVIKIRDTEASGGYANEKNKNRAPVAGYKICPPQTIFPYLDGKGRIEKWRRFFGTGRPFRDYPVEDVIHFKWDVKPGHLYGTPRIVCVRDDIFALRRLEENIELLLVNHLFPLFHVAVGTPEAPAQMTAQGVSEIDVVRSMIENMPKEGVFVTDERVKVTVHGAAKEGVDPKPVLAHYKQRIFTGLGVSGLDLGETDTGNRATAENVSQNLKDSIKADLDNFSDLVIMQVFRELFQESPSQLSVQNAVADVRIEFHEIDVDTQIKKETHAANMFNNHALSQSEFRRRLKLKPLDKESNKDTHYERHVVDLENVRHRNQKDLAKVQHGLAMEQQESAQSHQAQVAASVKKTKVTKKHANGASHTTETHEPAKPAQKAVAAIMQPQNQHGKNLDPHKARSSQQPDLLERIYDELLGMRAALDQEGMLAEWAEHTGSLVDDLLDGPELLAAREALKSFVRLSDDPDVLWLNLATWAQDPIPGDIEEVAGISA